MHVSCQPWGSFSSVAQGSFVTTYTSTACCQTFLVLRRRSVETKEVRLRPGTDSNDLATKLKSAIKFLDKVREYMSAIGSEGLRVWQGDDGGGGGVG
jgi:hypothetical protein